MSEESPVYQVTPAKPAAPVDPHGVEIEVLACYSRNDGIREWVEVGTWLHPGESIVVVSQEAA